MNKILFLDLENTIIGHWSNFTPMLKNIETINKIIVNEKITALGVFSYAVWCQENLDFLKTKLEELNSHFIVKIESKYVIPVQKMMEASVFANPTAHGLTLNDYWKFFSKEHAFIDYARHLTSSEPRRYSYLGLVDDTLLGNSIKIKMDNCSVGYHPV